VDLVSLLPQGWVYESPESAARNARTLAAIGNDSTDFRFDLHQKALTLEMTGLYAHPYAYYEPPLLRVDHPPERLCQHNTFLGVVARKKPELKAYPNHLDADVSDAVGYRSIELELPGIKDADSIALNWTSWRSLVVAGSSFLSWKLDTSVWPRTTSNGDRAGGCAGGSDLDAEALKDSEIRNDDVINQLPPFLVIGERIIGSSRREVDLPMDVVMENIKAKVEAGLLRTKVPKKSRMNVTWCYVRFSSWPDSATDVSMGRSWCDGVVDRVTLSNSGLQSLIFNLYKMRAPAPLSADASLSINGATPTDPDQVTPAHVIPVLSDGSKLVPLSWDQSLAGVCEAGDQSSASNLG
jgi:HSP20 family molecular chaperone IbpA